MEQQPQVSLLDRMLGMLALLFVMGAMLPVTGQLPGVTLSSVTPSVVTAGTIAVSRLVTISALNARCSGGTVSFLVGTQMTQSFISVSSISTLTTVISIPPVTSQTIGSLSVANGNGTVGCNTPSGASNSIPFTINPRPSFGTQVIAFVGRAYSQLIRFNGGTPPFRLISVSSINPGTVTLANNNLISGTPTSTSTITISALFSDSDSVFVSGSTTIPVYVPPSLTGTLSNAPVNQAYGRILTAASDPRTTPTSVVVSSGSLPPGLAVSFNNPTVSISGTPTQVGTYPFTLTVNDGAGGATAVNYSVTIFGPLTISPAAVTYPFPPNTLSTLQFTASGGQPPYTWRLPAEPLATPLSIDNTGLFRGFLPPGTYRVLLLVQDSASNSAQKDISLQVSAPFGVTSIQPTETTAGLASQTVTINGSGFCSATVASAGGISLATTFVSTAQITAVVPGSLLVAGSLSVNVTSPSSCAAPGSGAVQLTVNPPITSPITSLPNGATGQPYSQTLTATGGTAPRTLALTGTLPTGLSFAPATGLLSGTPTSSGTFPLTFHVTDAVGATLSVPLSLVIVGNTFTLTSVAPAATTAGIASQPITLNGTGFCTGTTVALDGTALTASSLTATQVTATIPGTLLTVPRNAQVQVNNNACPSRGTANLGFTINRALQAPSLSDGFVGLDYGETANPSSGGTAPYQVTVQGNLPPGLSFDANRFLRIAGVPTAAGSFPFTIQITDAVGAQLTSAVQIVIRERVSFTASSIPPATVGQAYRFVFAVNGGFPPYLFSAVSALPAGLTLSPDGILSGTPLTAGVFNLTIQAADSRFDLKAGPDPTPAPEVELTRSAVVKGGGRAAVFNPNFAQQTFSFQVLPGTPIPAPVQITPSTLPDGRVNQAYVSQVSGFGGTGRLRYQVANGTLPAGVSLSSDGFLSGTPTVAGVYPFTVQATDANGQSASAGFSIRILAAAITLAVPAPVNTVEQSAVSIALQASGGVAPFTAAVTAGSLPPGVSLNGLQIAGVPTTPGTYTATITVTDAQRNTATTTVSIVVVAQLRLPATSLSGGVPGSSYSATLAATGGTPPYQFSIVQGALPPGLVLNAASGLLSGQPTTGGIFAFTVQVSDGTQRTTQQYTVIIANGLSITTAALPAGIVNGAYSASLVAAGRSGVIQYSVSGTLPAGLSLDAATGVLSGTPTQSGSFALTVTATDGQQTTTRQFTLEIVPQLVFQTTSLSGGLIGSAYGQTVQATGGSGGLTYALSSGTLPSGVTLASNGNLSGTPTATGTFSFEVRVRDSNGNAAQRSFSLTVQLPALPSAQVGGVPDTPVPNAQPRLTVTLPAAFPTDITGTLTLTFLPATAVGGDDPAVVFSNNTRSLRFSIASGQTSATFDAAPVLSTGTTAGRIVLTFTAFINGQQVTVPGLETRTLTIANAPPVIRDVKVTRSASGFSFTVTGFVTSREVTQAVFRFTTSSGTLQSTDVTVPVQAAFSSFFGSSAAAPVGGQFSFTQPFSVNGSAAISGATVTLVNASGNSNVVAVTF